MPGESGGITREGARGGCPRLRGIVETEAERENKSSFDGGVWEFGNGMELAVAESFGFRTHF